MGRVRAEASLACTFLYIVPMVTDPKHNAGTFFPRGSSGGSQAADVATMHLTALKGQFTQLQITILSHLAVQIWF